MERMYKSHQEVIDHMNELIKARKPFRGISRDGSECIVVPLEIDEPYFMVAMVQFADEDKTPGYGERVDIEWLDFQCTDWTPIDLPESEWKQYLPEIKAE